HRRRLASIAQIGLVFHAASIDRRHGPAAEYRLETRTVMLRRSQAKMILDASEAPLDSEQVLGRLGAIANRRLDEPIEPLDDEALPLRERSEARGERSE